MVKKHTLLIQSNYLPLPPPHRDKGCRSLYCYSLLIYHKTWGKFSNNSAIICIFADIFNKICDNITLLT